MKLKMKLIAALALAVAVTSAQAQTGTTPKSKTHAKHVVAAKPSLEAQIEALRHDLESQTNSLNSLQQQLADRDAKLAEAKQAAADAQAAASKAQAIADAQTASASENANSANALKATVDDLKGNQTAVLASIQNEQKKVTASVENPTAIHYKGVTITPGGFVAAETVWRQKATGADLPTALSSIPFTGANATDLSEFYAGARQSRISALIEGKSKGVTYRGYTETDFLGVGTNSNNNQSNSYTLRERVFWAQAQLKSGLTFQGGQSWSLATERRTGLSNFSEDIVTPLTIDPNYVSGFAWARQYGFAVIQDLKNIPHLNDVAFGISVENAQTLFGNACPTATNTVLGATPATTVYSSCLVGGGSDTVSYVGGTATPGSATGNGVQGSSYNNLTGTYSYNLGPDIIGKVAVDVPHWGHYEAYGIGRFAHYEVYPNYNNALTPGNTNAALLARGKFTDSLAMGGVGGSLRIPTYKQYADFGFSGLWGYGVGRYGDSTLSDVIFDANGRMKALENVSALATLETHPTSRLTVYFNYGEDYAGRLIPAANNGGNSAYGYRGANNTGCNIENTPPQGATNPTSPSSANCGGNTKDVAEYVAGAWYDFYKGPAGRIRYGIQYGYVDRALWTGTAAGNGIAAPVPGYIANPHATENQFYTSFRYYLP
jgi:hypothetical protein